MAHADQCAALLERVGSVVDIGLRGRKGRVSSKREVTVAVDPTQLCARRWPGGEVQAGMVHAVASANGAADSSLEERQGQAAAGIEGDRRAIFQGSHAGAVGSALALRLESQVVGCD